MSKSPQSGPVRSRATRACDSCKSRRARCKLVPSLLPGTKPQCELCIESKQECTFTAPVKRRGPQRGFRKVDKDDADKDPPLCGLPPDLVDQLLAVYFAHVHNVWPILYKPLFDPYTASRQLLLAILAISACVCLPPEGEYGPEKLFAMAEESVRGVQDEGKIETIQALVLLSLRQTGNGHKQSAFMYAGRACVGTLSIGLGLKPPGPISHTDLEIRSRTYWNVFLLDKVLAEETGRPFLVPNRRSSIPLPSIHESDELEAWPPLTLSTSLLPASVRHVTPRRGYIMSCFVWGVRLAIILEDILNLDTQPRHPDEWEEQWERWKYGTAQDVEGLAHQLEYWRKSLPAHLEVEMDQSPLPNCIVLLAWYNVVKILLHSRFTTARFPNAQPFSPLALLIEHSHQVCAEAAQEAIDLFALADRHKLLLSISSDIIHILCMTTLFVAFDSTHPDEAVAHRAKINFAQCCLWLRDFSAAWPTASAHKVFFDGLIQGGLSLSSTDGDEHHLDSGTLGIRGGLATLRHDLFGRQENPDIFSLPQIYWNQMTDDPWTVSINDMWDDGATTSAPTTAATGTTGASSATPAPSTGTSVATNGSSTAVGSVSGSLVPGKDDTSSQNQSTMYAALMNYMMQAARAQ